ncbi:MAG TPA: glycosyltransferase family 25 protein [Chitinophagaceae bacterium]|nr:glycosyltransferase family 25 protein [Chitinophagaceae bacterium]
MNDLTPFYEKLNNFFDHIYVMTIRRATERQEKLHKVLKGLNFNFLIGADNKDFNVDELVKKGVFDPVKAKEVHRYNKPFNMGMLGCTITHRMVYEDVVKKGYKKVLIFEDDILPSEDGLKLFPNILKELPADWEMIYFDYNKNTERTPAGFIKQKFYHVQKAFGGLNLTHKTIDNLYARPYSNHLKIAGHHDFGSAYALTQSAAQKLLQLQTPIAYWSDHLLAYAASNRLVNAYLTVPKLFVQESQFNKAVVGSYAEEA